MSVAREPTGTELVITRIFDAPRTLVFDAWTDAERAKHWWGPKGFTTPICDIDLRVGGTAHCCMRSPEGQDYWSIGEYREIDRPERLVYTDAFSDEEGNVVSPSYYGMTGDWPEQMVVTVTFEDFGGKTKLTLQHAGIPAGENRDMAEAGWTQSFDKLNDYLVDEIANSSDAE